MDRRLTFNEEVINYEKHRPKYCRELFDSIIEYAQLNEKKKAIEVGIGTGQATTPILKTGCSLTAIELGDNLASYSKVKFKEYDNFRICNIAFEDYNFDNNSIDLIYSGTAFHWIPEEVGYRKTYEMLRSGGVIALFWNRPFLDNLDIYKELQAIDNSPKIGSVLKDKNEIIKAIREYGFIDLQFKLMRQSRKLNAEEYILFLNTYSAYISMENIVKEKLNAEIQNVINRYGGNVIIHDTIDLYLAKKP